MFTIKARRLLIPAAMLTVAAQVAMPSIARADSVVAKVCQADGPVTACAWNNYHLIGSAGSGAYNLNSQGSISSSNHAVSLEITEVDTYKYNEVVTVYGWQRITWGQQGFSGTASVTSSPNAWISCVGHYAYESVIHYAYYMPKPTSQWFYGTVESTPNAPSACI